MSKKKEIFEHKVDMDFIIKLEDADGVLDVEGFVPMENGRVIGRSGVTIGHGIDLGAQDKETLEDLNVPKSLIEKLEPYLLQRKRRAVKLLEEKPLVLEEDDVKLLNNVFMVRDITAVHNRVGDINSLPPQAQTVLVSLVRNFGPSALHFITSKDIVAGRIEAAVKRLRDENDWSNPELQERRNKEADLLETIGKKPKVKKQEVVKEPKVEAPEEEVEKE